MNDILDSKGTQSNFSGHKSLPNATAILVLGIISIVTCWLYGVPGLICGIIALSLFNKDKRIYMEDPAAYENSFKNAKAGQVCAIIGLSLSALYVLIILIAVAIGASFARF